MRNTLRGSWRVEAGERWVPQECGHVLHLGSLDVRPSRSQDLGELGRALLARTGWDEAPPHLPTHQRTSEPLLSASLPWLHTGLDACPGPWHTPRATTVPAGLVPAAGSGRPRPRSCGQGPRRLGIAAAAREGLTRRSAAADRPRRIAASEPPGFVGGVAFPALAELVALWLHVWHLIQHPSFRRGRGNGKTRRTCTV